MSSQYTDLHIIGRRASTTFRPPTWASPAHRKRVESNSEQLPEVQRSAIEACICVNPLQLFADALLAPTVPEPPDEYECMLVPRARGI